MAIIKPSIDGAISSIAKGIKQLEAVAVQRGKDAARMTAEAARLNTDIATAGKEAERAARIKAKLEELVA